MVSNLSVAYIWELKDPGFKLRLLDSSAHIPPHQSLWLHPRDTETVLGRSDPLSQAHVADLSAEGHVQVAGG